jgi:hypothetical protein
VKKGNQAAQGMSSFYKVRFDVGLDYTANGYKSKETIFMIYLHFVRKPAIINEKAKSLLSD